MTKYRRYQTPAQYLGKIKKKLGLKTDAAVARELGVTKQAVGHWKANRYSIGLLEAHKIGAILEESPVIIVAETILAVGADSKNRERWQHIYLSEIQKRNDDDQLDLLHTD